MPVPPNIQCENSSIGGSVCQLYIGHDAEHAALIARHRQRVLRRWLTGKRPFDRPFTATTAAGLPWAPGHPSLSETTLAAGLHVVAGEAAASDSAAADSTDTGAARLRFA